MPSNGPVAYFDIPTHDAERARTFWGGLFGWTFSEGNVPGYDMIGGSSPLAGLDATAGSGPVRVYFGVEDIVAAVRTVRGLGGHADEPVTLPSGRFSRCADDQGTAFTLWQDGARS